MSKSIKSKSINNAQSVIDAIQYRIDNADNANQVKTLNAELKILNSEHGLGALSLASSKYDIDLTQLAKHISVLKAESKSDFLAVYALQKVRKMIISLAGTTKSGLDGYSNAILFNLATLQNLTNKEARMTMSNSIEYSELEQVNAIKRTMNCNESTASTQASSTRMMLRALNICNVVKQKNNDVISFADTKASAQVIAFYAK